MTEVLLKKSLDVLKKITIITMPKVSMIVPIWDMQNIPLAISLLERNLESIRKQGFTDYEVIVSDDSVGDDLYKWLVKYTADMGLQVEYCRNPGNKGMANNTNYAIEQANGDIIKILFQDDYLYTRSSLQDIVQHFTPTFNWLVTSCVHTYDGMQVFNPHHPHYSYSENTIGSPSVLAFRREVRERFDPQFHWVLDLDLYRRLFKHYGRPKMLHHVNVVIGLHEGQMTNKLTYQQKTQEFVTLNDKYNQL